MMEYEVFSALHDALEQDITHAAGEIKSSPSSARTDTRWWLARQQRPPLSPARKLVSIEEGNGRSAEILAPSAGLSDLNSGELTQNLHPRCLALTPLFSARHIVSGARW
jgi:hypothetical protein